MNVEEFINIIAPEHGRTSCSDKDLNNGFYSNKKFTRCGRCTLLQIVKEGFLPETHKITISCEINEVKKQKVN